jgi:hypothetical protein
MRAASARTHALYFKRLHHILDSMLCPVPQVEITHRMRTAGAAGPFDSIVADETARLEL